MKRIIPVLLPAALLMLLSFSVTNSFSFKVSGKITDRQGFPLAGVSVMEKGTRNGTYSATDGSYTLTVKDEKAVLVFSSVGYDNKEVRIKNQAVVNVSMVHTQDNLEEVVVTGYSSGLPGAVAGVQTRKMAAPSYNRLSDSYSESPKYYYQKTDDEFNTEGYDHITENSFLKVTDNPLSTFSIDVDAASYSNIRRFLNDGQLPPAGAVRIEEMVNYFHYNYPQPENKDPFTVSTEIASCPWNSRHQLVMIGLQGKKIPVENLPSSNLTFLIDVSGSMQSPNKLPLVKQSLKMLTEQLRENDRVSIVVYAGAAGLVLPPTSGEDKESILEAIDKLEAGGSTAGGAGIQLAYKTAEKNFMKNGNNRVILCTDGDFNVGESSDDAMERLIEKERETGVFLTVLGYGMGNYKDNKMQKLADKGNGNHAYIDGLSEAKKVLVNEFGGTLFTIAKDVKLQLEFNPSKVQGYRLIGYENRMLAKEDFNNDKKDAGELGSGHTVTALYEIIPAGIKDTFLTKVDDLKYQSNKQEEPKEKFSDEMLTVKLRYKAPDGNQSKLIEHPVIDQQVPFAETSDNFRFAASVAEFGMLLRDSPFKSASSYEEVIRTAKKAKGNDEEGYRKEFVKLAEKARSLYRNSIPEPDDEEDGTY